jgi:hypothetical protein
VRLQAELNYLQKQDLDVGFVALSTLRFSLLVGSWFSNSPLSAQKDDGDEMESDDDVS